MSPPTESQLTAYALGEGNAQERAEITAWCAQHPAAAATVSAIQATAQQVSSALQDHHRQSSPAGLDPARRAKLMASASGQPRQRSVIPFPPWRWGALAACPLLVGILLVIGHPEKGPADLGHAAAPAMEKRTGSPTAEAIVIADRQDQKKEISRSGSPMSDRAERPAAAAPATSLKLTEESLAKTKVTESARAAAETDVASPAVAALATAAPATAAPATAAPAAPATAARAAPPPPGNAPAVPAESFAGLPTSAATIEPTDLRPMEKSIRRYHVATNPPFRYIPDPPPNPTGAEVERIDALVHQLQVGLWMNGIRANITPPTDSAPLAIAAHAWAELHPTKHPAIVRAAWWVAVDSSAPVLFAIVEYDGAEQTLEISHQADSNRWSAR